NLPRFQPENLEYNTKIFDRVNEIAQRKGCTPSQLALAWVHHQGDDVCPIPGTTKLENLRQNIGALSVKLMLEEMAELESIATSEKVKGERYPPDVPTWKDSETPPFVLLESGLRGNPKSWKGIDQNVLRHAFTEIWILYSIYRDSLGALVRRDGEDRESLV
ncbi:hypothetical protein CRG98_042313, partial [Punica granatum]